VNGALRCQFYEWRPQAQCGICVGRAYTLGELSSATRLQLLLAVRLAFVEAQENGLQLPLFLDETLGTSDDFRASAIIDAVLALCESGRQVFYFTAQRDELAKWMTALNGRGLEHRIHDLAVLRRIPPEAEVHLPLAGEVAAVAPVVPSIDNHTHESYRSALGVPPIVPGATPSTATHLWYFVDELRSLHSLLLSGVTTWGEVQNLIQLKAMPILTEHPSLVARGTALAKALDMIHTEWVVGRGRPVDTTALERSGAVSERMMPAVAKRASQCGFEGKRLLEALEGKQVAGFQSKKVADLREFLEKEGNVDYGAKRSMAEIRSLMVAQVNREIEGGVISAGDIDTLLGRMALGTQSESVEVPLALPDSPVPVASGNTT
jgi:hypothetical protein